MVVCVSVQVGGTRGCNKSHTAGLLSGNETKCSIDVKQMQ